MTFQITTKENVCHFMSLKENILLFFSFFLHIIHVLPFCYDVGRKTGTQMSQKKQFTINNRYITTLP